MRLLRIMPILVVLLGVSVAGCADESSPPATDVQRDLDTLVGAARAGGAALVVKGAGPELRVTSGVADKSTGAPMRSDQQVRIGSVTKSFTAALVLSLVRDGRVDLDAPAERYVPELVSAGSEPAPTVRQVLQHTSGLPECTTSRAIMQSGSGGTEQFTPERILQIAMQSPRQFRPGEQMKYTNTNYIVAGLIASRVSGVPVSRLLQQRIAEPLGLRNTYLPEPGERMIRGPHPTGYWIGPDGVDTALSDTETSAMGAAGGIVSTPDDLIAFFDALRDGTVLDAATSAQLHSAVPMGGRPGLTYGLGLMHATFGCGVQFWGHAGDVPGYTALAGSTSDGRGVALTITGAVDHDSDMLSVVDRAVCAQKAS
ncbi:serine hydrolase domain-containing protein [Antrihabitans cavernicola]|nr:serine hydrolase domain-containing protein [Spelaeibacter cavernicola]